MRGRKRKADQKRRSARWPARGMSRSKPRSHPKAIKSRTAYRLKAAALSKRTKRTRAPLRSDPRIEIAVREMNRGRSLTTAARSLGFPPKTLQTHLRRLGLLKRKGRRWVFKDDRLRKVVITTGGRSRTVTVRGYGEASVASAYQQAARQFLSTNRPKFLDAFKGRSVQAADGRRYRLETDPNSVHRIAAMDSPPFHEIYEISSTD
jgi:hypothetical protein